MFVVGLTGGIGSGKTTAANRFNSLGVPIIDADVVARDIVKPGRPALQEIINSFGDDVVDSEGRLDRAALRGIVFSNPDLRKKLENILHPQIYERIHNELGELSGPYAIIVIPLLAESKRQYHLNRVLVVDAPSELQISRVTVRDKQSPSQVERILHSQSSRRKRNSIADDIIENSGSIDDLCDHIDALHRQYLVIADHFKKMNHDQSS